MWALWVIAVLFLTVGSVGEGWAEDAIGTRSLLTIARKDLHTILPSDCHILIDPHSIEQFLDVLDGNPPDWGLVYGHGHQDPDYDERLFTLNRARDAKREGKEALQWTVVFLWSADPAMRSVKGKRRSSGRWSFCGQRIFRATIRRLVGLAWPLGRSLRRPDGALSDSNLKKSRVISS